MRRFLALLAALLVLPGLATEGAAQSDVCVDLAGPVRAGFGPESWKGDARFQTRNEYQFQNQTRFWGTSLGHNVTLPVRLVDCASRQVLGGADDFTVTAWVETGADRLYAYVANGSRTADTGTLPPSLGPTRTFEVRFDVDGATVYADPGAPQAAKEFPALGYGLQVVTVEVRYAQLPGESPLPPAGKAELTFFLEQPTVSTALGVVGFPERALRKFSDFGAGATVPMVQFPLAYDANVTVPVTFRFTPASANRPVEVRAYHAVRTGPGAPGTPPLPGGASSPAEVAGGVAGLGNAGVSLVGTPVATGTVGRDGVFNATVSMRDHVPVGGELVFVAGSLTGQGGIAGSAGVLLPIARPQAAVTLSQFLVAEAPDARLNRVTVVFRDGGRGSGNPNTGLGPGDLVLLRPMAGSFDLLARGAFEPRDQRGFVRSTVSAAPMLDVGANRYAAAGVFYTTGGPTTDQFYGLSWGERGFTVFAAPQRLVEKRTGAVTVSFQSHTTNYDSVTADPALEMRLRVRVPNMPDGSVFTANVTLTERGAAVLDIPVVAPNRGDYALSVNVTTGDLDAGTPVTVKVLSEDEFNRSQRKWWQVPGFGAEAGLAALAAVALAMGRRRRAA